MPPPDHNPQARVERALPEYGLQPTPAQVERFTRYVRRIASEEKVRLVGDRDPALLVRRHLGESLFLGQVLDLAVAGAGGLLDLGSGAGFPGLALALGWTELKTTLVESNGKKARFLREAVQDLGLEARVEVRQEFWQRRRPVGVEAWPGLITVRALEGMDDVPAWLGRWMGPEARAAFWVSTPVAGAWRTRYPGWRWEAPRLIPGSRERVIVVGNWAETRA